ncbi:C-terminal binding protein [Haloplanus pelagicus]|jgi:D-3-phosphoglycerate dehydrogenase|uniref:C-terminal binding protein n=1 Tax=Haloplanus pelagicus TaxID=2949995 RepID=UPI00203A531B|nr:C-terminal binding protein [Haloplanus sp. HW8-1]
MTHHIVVTDHDFPDLSVETAALDGADVDLRGESARTPEAVIEAAEGADGLLVQYAEITPAVFEALPDLQAVGRYGIGVDSVDLDAATAHGVQVVNVPDYCIEEVPTHALALLLACIRKVPAYDRTIRDGTWDWTDGKPIHRLTGATLGVVGFGKLPRRLLELVAGFDLDVLVYDPYVDAGEIEAVGAEKVDLDDLLARAKYVSVHAPLTEETHHLLDAAAFERMREDAILVNTARGALVDVDALVDAVESEEIAGAGLDVLPEEPPDPTPPSDHEAIVYTPHVAWYSETSMETMRRTVAEDVLGILRGEPARNPVNDPDGGE